MGFLDIFRKKEEPPEEPAEEGKPVSVKLDSLESRVKEIISGRLEREKREAEEIYGEIKEHFSGIKELNSFLEAKSFEKQDRTYAKINMIKNNYVKRSYSLLGSVPSLGRMGYEELKSFHEKAGKIASDLKNTDPKQAFLLSRYFKHETGEIIKKLKSIEDSLSSLNSIIGSGGGAMWLEKEISGAVKSISGQKERVSEMEEKLEEFGKRKDNLEKMLDSEKEKLKQFTESGVYKRMTAIEEKIEESKEQRKELEAEIRNRLSEIKRPMKKIEYFMRTEEGEKGIAEDFDRILHSPTKTFLSEGGENKLGSVLRKTKELMDQEKVSLKGSDKEHVLDLLMEAEKETFSALKKKYSEISGELDSMIKERKSSKATEEKDRKEKEIGGMERDISETEKEIEDLSDALESEKEKTKDMIKDLEKLLEEKLKRKFEVEI